APPIVRLVDVHKSFGAVEVLRGISFDVGRGEAVCIIGPSGSGTSTLLRCINGLVGSDHGEIPSGSHAVHRFHRDAATAAWRQAVLFDEVTAALDAETRKEVLVTIRQLIEEGMTSILVTHEMAFAREIAHHVYFTDQGLIVEHGPPVRLLGDPQKQRTRAFLE